VSASFTTPAHESPCPICYRQASALFNNVIQSINASQYNECPCPPQAPCPPCLDPLPSFLNRSCREDVLGGKFNCSLGRRLDGLPLPVLLLLDFGDGGPRNQMLDREFLFVGMWILLACFFVLFCNIMDRFGDFGGVEGVKVSVSGMFLGDVDIVRGRDEWVLGGMLQ